MRVLSLFDGCGMAWQSLKNAGIEVTEGFSSEIDKSAIKVTSTNHPEIKHLGSVTDWKEWGNRLVKYRPGCWRLPLSRIQ